MAQVLEWWHGYTDDFRFEMGITPFSHWSYIAASSALYLIVIFAVRYLTPRPSKFVVIQAAHNLFLSIFSFVMLAGVLHEAYQRLSVREFLPALIYAGLSGLAKLSAVVVSSQWVVTPALSQQILYKLGIVRYYSELTSLGCRLVY